MKKINRKLVALALAIAGTAGAITAIPSPGSAQSGLLVYGISNLGEFCGPEACGPTNICCRIVVDNGQ